MTFPVKVEYYEQRAKIYRPAANFPFYRVAFKVAGKRRMLTFGSYGEAKAAAEAKVKELHKGQQSSALTAKQAQDAITVRDMLTAYRQETGNIVSIVELTGSYLAAIKQLPKGCSLTDAIRAYRQSIAAVLRKPLADAVKEFCDARRPKGVSQDGNPLTEKRVAPWIPDRALRFEPKRKPDRRAGGYVTRNVVPALQRFDGTERCGKMVCRHAQTHEQMKPERKSIAPKNIRLTDRKRYSWYLRPPFKDTFTRHSWWKSQAKIEPVAALYEIARRHPLVPCHWLKAVAAMRKNRWPYPFGLRLTGKGGFANIISVQNWFSDNIKSGSMPHSLYWTCQFGMRSWTELNSWEREQWELNVGTLKGLDFREDVLQCRSITEWAEWKIRDSRVEGMCDKVTGIPRGREMGKVITADLAANPPTTEEWEAAIAHRAIEAHRQGFLLMAVAPDLESDVAATVLQKVYGHTKRRFANPKQRARWQDWLPLISEFEDAPHSPKSPLFVRYRRVIDGIHFA